MNRKNDNTAIVGVGVVACAACCAGPIIGFLAAIGIGTAAAVALFGTIGLMIAAIGLLIVVRRRRRARERGTVAVDTRVEPPTVRSQR